MSKQEEVEASPPAYNDVSIEPPVTGCSQQPYPQQPYPQQPYPQQPYTQQQYPTQYYAAQPCTGEAQQVGGQTVVVTQQPMIIQQVPLSNPPNDYMAVSIFATFCCCWLVGIFAIMKSSECRDAIQRGDQNLALQKSAEAKRMVKLAVGLGIASLVIGLCIMGVYIGLVFN